MTLSCNTALASWGPLVVLAALVISMPVACTGNRGDEALSPEQVYSSALSQVGVGVVEPALEQFIVESQALEDALTVWSTTPNSSTLIAAKQQWVDTMLIWQQLEVMQLGPSVSLRDEVYSWPVSSGCRIDQELVYGNWSSAAWLDTMSVNTYGLDAVEHLLFAELENDCSASVDINTEGTWAALSPEDITASRAAMAIVLARHIRETGAELLTLWEEDYSRELATAASFSSEQEAINSVYAALLYLETSTHEDKLGLPLGEHPDCGSATCPEDIEHPRSGLSTRSIHANLIGFQTLFTGGSGQGLDDILVAVGEPSLSVTLLSELDQVIAATSALDGPLDQAIIDNYDDVMNIFDELDDVIELLTGHIATVLLLQAPPPGHEETD